MSDMKLRSRLVVACISALAIAALNQCGMPGQVLGIYSTNGTLATNTCGAGLEAPSPWKFNVELSQQTSDPLLNTMDGSPLLLGRGSKQCRHDDERDWREPSTRPPTARPDRARWNVSRQPRALTIDTVQTSGRRADSPRHAHLFVFGDLGIELRRPTQRIGRSLRYASVHRVLRSYGFVPSSRTDAAKRAKENV